MLIKGKSLVATLVDIYHFRFCFGNSSSNETWKEVSLSSAIEEENAIYLLFWHFSEMYPPTVCWSQLRTWNWWCGLCKLHSEIAAAKRKPGSLKLLPACSRWDQQRWCGKPKHGKVRGDSGSSGTKRAEGVTSWFWTLSWAAQFLSVSWSLWCF